MHHTQRVTINDSDHFPDKLSMYRIRICEKQDNCVCERVSMSAVSFAFSEPEMVRPVMEPENLCC